MEKQKDGEILLHIRMRVKIQRVESLKGIGRRSGYYVYDMMTAIRKVFKTSTQKDKRSRRRDLNSPSMELTHGLHLRELRVEPDPQQSFASTEDSAEL